MKRFVVFIYMLLFLITYILPASASVPNEEDIVAEAVVLMDAETGQVLYEKNSNDRKHPASITKIMTGLLVMEHLEAADTIIVSEAAVDLPSWSSSAYLKADEQLTVEQTMYAMMLRSGNDAANVFAEAVGGSVNDFAQMMNSRAQELGAKNTTFSNPHGLTQRNHMTTAYDMALITREAIHTPGFLTYFGKDSYSMSATNKNDARIFTNTHRMLLSNYAQYDETVIGGKTGYTTPSGYTLVTVAHRDGRTLICVVLDSDSFYSDTQTLLDFGFDEFTPYTYNFEDNGIPHTVSVWDGDLEAGRAYLTFPESAFILLHESIEAEDLSIIYQYPEHPDINDELEGHIDIKLPERTVSGLPSSLLSIPLQIEKVALDLPVEDVMETSVEVQSENGIIVPLLVSASVGILVVFLVIMAIRRFNRRRAFRRRKRLLYKYNKYKSLKPGW